MDELDFKFRGNKLSVCLRDCRGASHQICKIDFNKLSHMKNSEITDQLEQDILLNLILEDIPDGKSQLIKSVDKCLELAA